MSEFRPRLLLCLVTILALAALGISAIFSVDVGRAADKSGLEFTWVCVVGHAHRIGHPSPRLGADR